MCSDREEPTGRLRSALLVTKCKLILVLKKEGSDIFFFLQAFSCCLLAVQGRANPKPLHHGSLLRCLPPKQESAGVQRSSRDSKKGITNFLPKDAAIPTKSFSLQNAVSLERLMEFDMLTSPREGILRQKRRHFHLRYDSSSCVWLCTLQSRDSPKTCVVWSTFLKAQLNPSPVLN